MAKLTRRATRQALESLCDLYTLRLWDDLTNHLVGSLPTLIPTEICSHNGMNPSRRHAAYRMWPPAQLMTPDAPEAFETILRSHSVENRHAARAAVLERTGHPWNHSRPKILHY
jgi:hypothetical protein